MKLTKTIPVTKDVSEEEKFELDVMAVYTMSWIQTEDLYNYYRLGMMREKTRITDDEQRNYCLSGIIAILIKGGMYHHEFLLVHNRDTDLYRLECYDEGSDEIIYLYENLTNEELNGAFYDWHQKVFTDEMIEEGRKYAELVLG